MPTALVTGATSGIGRELARHLAQDGYDLVLVARTASRLQALTQELIASWGIRCEILVADLTNYADTERVEQRLQRGDVGVLINNAGFGLGRSFEATDIADEQRLLDIHVRAVVRLTHAVLPLMIRAGSGQVLNVASVAGFVPRGTYGAAKAWIIAFSKWANARYRHDGVHVMALCPGYVRTEFHQRIGVDMARLPSWMCLDADEVARVGLADLRRGRAVSIPGRRYRVLVLLGRAAPTRIVEKVLRLVSH